VPDWKEREKTNVIGSDHPQPDAPSHAALASEGKPVRSDADAPQRQEAETPKPLGDAGDAPASGDPSRGMIDEGGAGR
jgi:hypothetical protein